MNDSWVEKFRPKKLIEISSQEEIVLSLKKCIEIKNIPHLLFFGPSGCGKTSVILALARELFGEKYWEDRVIELNASDERGIKVVRDKIKRYAQTSVVQDSSIPPWKIIILDEADNMTSDSQFALRKIMEDYSKVTRFCIICNYHNKIIDPIISRCSMYRFKPIPILEIKNRLKDICSIEDIYCSDENIKIIINICRGDMRKAINFLQRCKNHRYFLPMGETKLYDSINDINIQLINEISGIIPQDQMITFIDRCIDQDISQVENIINNFYNNAYSLTIQLNHIINHITMCCRLSSTSKSLIIEKIVSIDQHLLNGCDEYIQFYRLAYNIILFSKNEII
jgi:replication factor C subunit 2/4